MALQEKVSTLDPDSVSEELFTDAHENFHVIIEGREKPIRAEKFLSTYRNRKKNEG